MFDKLFYTHFNYKHNFYNLPTKPTIYVANYVMDRIENISCILIPTRLCVIMGSGFIDHFKLNKIVKYTHATRKHSGEYQEVKSSIKNKLNSGISVFSYISRPFISNHIGKVRSGMFRIAKELNVTITPIYFDYIKHSYGVIPFQDFNIVVGDTFYVNNIELSVYRTKLFFKKNRKKLNKI